ncbi:MAG: hypothetical protein RLZZ546_3081, partial [Bacteroidota bacterium]
MDKTFQYITHIQTLISKVLDSEMNHIREAGELVASTILKGGFVYTFGTGHSHMMAEELFY